MRKFLLIGVSLLLGLIAGVLSHAILTPILPWDKPLGILLISIGIGGIVIAICLLLGPVIIRFFDQSIQKLAMKAASFSTNEIISCAFGLIIGLIIASLLGAAVARIAVVGTYLALLLMLIFGYIGMELGYKKTADLSSVFTRLRSSDNRDKLERRDPKKAQMKIPPKVLDTSVIIDGRIMDIYRTGFLEGDLVIANFVLEELRHIADSSDNLKRARGRNGLDCLNMMRKEFTGHIIISNKDYSEDMEVDDKLLRLAEDIHGVVVTNDFNLNKVAQLQNIKVLNINELSNAVKPVVLPGEEISVLVVKEGKEAGQGVAYLDDGTMIVVENGKRFMGRQIPVTVTSILQTSAGRMVFVRPKPSREWENREHEYQVGTGN